jgi:hypothetical protein
MPLIWVPPVNASPNQKGARAETNCASEKAGDRHAVIGAEASLVPARQRHWAPVGMSVSARCPNAIPTANPAPKNPCQKRPAAPKR